MSSISGQLSVKNRVKSALERIESIEGDLPKLVAGVNNGFANLEQRLNEFTEILNAISQLVGEKTVGDQVTSNRIARAEAMAQAQKEGLEKALAEGKVTVAEAAGEKTVIVGKEFDKDGNLIPPGRIQMEFRQIVPSFKEKFTGIKVGGTVETPNGGKIEVVELYDIADPPPEAANADAPADVATDAADAAPAAAAPATAAVAADATPTAQA